MNSVVDTATGAGCRVAAKKSGLAVARRAGRDQRLEIDALGIEAWEQDRGIAEPAAAEEQTAVSHNLLGQRLGRKGRDTRDRILAATAQLLADPSDAPISLSAVAREASLAMTSLYLYFSDLTELLLAALEPIMASADEAYIAHLRTRWPDQDLALHCEGFVRAYHAFWQHNTRILHLRNSLADAKDPRMGAYRIEVSQPLIQLLDDQMDGAKQAKDSPASEMAGVALTGIERLITIATDASFPKVRHDRAAVSVDLLLKAQARLLELAIRDCRESARRDA